MNSVSHSISRQKVVITLLLIFLGFGIGMNLGQSKNDDGFFFSLFKKKEAQKISTSENTVIKVVSEESQVIDVVKKSTPAVVSIVASADVPKMERCYKEMEDIDPFFREFFEFRVPTYCEKGVEKKTRWGWYWIFSIK